MTPKHDAKPSRRELVKMAGAGVLGLGTLQGAGTPRKLLHADPTGTAPAVSAIRSGHLLFVSGIGGHLVQV